MGNVFIYSGIPGSGKTTMAKEEHPEAFFCSADDFFWTEDVECDDRPRIWKYDPSKIGEAHASCLRRFVFAVTSRIDDPIEIVVDNTNGTIAEIAPYAAVALAYGYELLITTLHIDPKIAYARNTHSVPFATIAAIYKNINSSPLPPWWPSRELHWDVATRKYMG